jgi:hypothetical protein
MPNDSYPRNEAALTAFKGTKRPIRRDRRDQLDEIPGAFGFLGRLNLDQVEIVHHVLVLADAPLRCRGRS